MDAITAQRTLVKSSPELWAQLSDHAELARHLGEFGEIRITRLEAERTVVWEGERARGTVELEPSGWGTKVTLTAEPAGALEEAAAGPAASPAPKEAASPEPAASPAPEQSAAEPAAWPAPVRPTAEDPDVARALSTPVFDRTVESAALEVPVPDPAPDPDPEPSPDPAPEPGPDPAPPRKPGFFARLFGRRRAPEAPPETGDQSTPDTELPTSRTPPATAAGRQAAWYDAGLPEEDPVVDESDPLVDETDPVVDETDPLEGDTDPLEDPAPPLVDAVQAEPHGEPERAATVLEAVLDELGAAHHRPFSRG